MRKLHSVSMSKPANVEYFTSRLWQVQLTIHLEIRGGYTEEPHLLEVLDALTRYSGDMEKTGSLLSRLREGL